MNDRPKSLGNKEDREKRMQMLTQEHIKPLAHFVHSIRKKRGIEEKIPYFDPLDGGIHAKCLFVLEAPGPKAVKSGFVSRNNPDESAKNFLELNERAGIPRKETITWNIVPWYIGSEGKIRPANPKDIEEGFGYLLQLIALLQELKVIVLVGRKAQGIRERLRQKWTRCILECYHPSPMFVNRAPERRDMIVHDLRCVAEVLGC